MCLHGVSTTNVLLSAGLFCVGWLVEFDWPTIALHPLRGFQVHAETQAIERARTKALLEGQMHRFSAGQQNASANPFKPPERVARTRLSLGSSSRPNFARYSVSGVTKFRRAEATQYQVQSVQESTPLIPSLPSQPASATVATPGAVSVEMTPTES